MKPPSAHTLGTSVYCEQEGGRSYENRNTWVNRKPTELGYSGLLFQLNIHLVPRMKDWATDEPLEKHLR